jgi:hypothetical protein
VTRARVEEVADAVLYEGYVLYPYRPSSVKNRRRWTFGGVYPRAYAEAQSCADAWRMQTECLLRVRAGCSLSVRVRFLHLLERKVWELETPCEEWPETGLPTGRSVPEMRIGDRTFAAWQEATARDIRAENLDPLALLHQPVSVVIDCPATREVEPLPAANGATVGALVRRHEAIQGEVELAAERLTGDLFRLRVVIRNHTPLSPTDAADRERALPHTLISTHAILHTTGGEFVSLLDPPEDCRDAGAACVNVGTWPVLAGEDGGADAVLSSPIILYDHPRVAPESPGDLFDATEIDEILTLRILTLTDAEKAEARAADERARRVLDRTESLARDQFAGLHGTLRAAPAAGDPWAGWGAEKPVQEYRRDDGVLLRPGDRVRLRPRAGGDVFDMALAGRVAVVASVEQDFDGRFYLSVTVEDDPGRDLGAAGLPGHRFYFTPAEVDPLDTPGGA